MKKLLIIDDEAVIRDSIEIYFEDSGFSVQTAENGKSGLEIFSTQQPDIVLVDLRMPGIDGLEIIKTITTNKPEVPVIVFSGTGILADSIEAMRLGAWDYVEKPVYDMAILVHRVDKALERATFLVKERAYREDLENMVRQRTAELEKELTERKHTEYLLRKSKNEWQYTFNAMNDIITLQNKNMQIIKANKAAYQFFNLKPGELTGRHCYEIFRDISMNCEGCPIIQTIEKEKCHSEIIRHEKLGKTFYVSSAPVFSENGEIEYIVHIAKDITDIKKLEEELFQTHKIEAIGTLAGGIAHDFNNILSVILGYAALAQDNVVRGNSPKNELEQVIVAGRRATDLVKQILMFSRKAKDKREPIFPYLIVNESLKLLKSTLPSTLELQSDIQARDVMILANQTHIQQIVVNLCTNALHAIKNEKGMLQVKLARKNLTASDIDPNFHSPPGPFVELTVTDTGCGMNNNTINHIFEPYFTTKTKGEGTGLGLSIINGIVRDYKGMIKVKSKLGQGSTFRIYFPIIEGEIEIEKFEKPMLFSIKGERILTIDDEGDIVGLHKNALERLGYKVTARTNSQDALKTFREADQDFDIIITDQTMPSLSGLELAKEILKIRQDIPIIMCTGYSTVIEEEKAKEIGITKFLMKPVGWEKLSKIVREILDKTA